MKRGRNKKMNELKEKIERRLEAIRDLKGVEGVLITQREGNPIQSSGVWLSKDENFSVSSAISKIYNSALRLHPKGFFFVLIEGRKGKVSIAPLKATKDTLPALVFEEQGIIEDYEYVITIVTLPNVNFGSIFFQINNDLLKMKQILTASGENFKPPREFLDQFELQGDVSKKQQSPNYAAILSKKSSQHLSEVLNNFSIAVPDLKYSVLLLEGGFIAAKIVKEELNHREPLEAIATTTYSLFQTSKVLARILTKMEVKSILFDCETSFQFIYRGEKVLLNSHVNKGKYKFGLLRLTIPQFTDQLERIID